MQVSQFRGACMLAVAVLPFDGKLYNSYAYNYASIQWLKKFLHRREGCDRHRRREKGGGYEQSVVKGKYASVGGCKILEVGEENDSPALDVQFCVTSEGWL